MEKPLNSLPGCVPLSSYRELPQALTQAKQDTLDAMQSTLLTVIAQTLEGILHRQSLRFQELLEKIKHDKENLDKWDAIRRS